MKRRLFARVRGAAHRAAVWSCSGAGRAFEAALADVRGTQTAQLQRILRAVTGTEQAKRFGLRTGMSAEAFRAQVPEAQYADVAAAIEAQRSGQAKQLTAETCERYQPTSGSSARIKWIPYTKMFLDELDRAVSPWGHDLYRRYPRIAGGRHYWSLSWLPTNLRAVTAANVNDDRALLSWSKRLFSAATAPVPPWVTTTPTSDDSLFATLCFLAAADDLTLLSVWSPTFALNLLEQLAVQREALIEVLDIGHWDLAHAHLPGRPPRSLRAAQLLRAWDGKQDPAFFVELWPQLALVSAWATSTSARWATGLTELLPHAQLQGKGLWATEGVVTIPFRDKYPLAVRSHFFEFVALDTGRVHFAWELRSGQLVRPLLTTGSGLLRYALKDRLLVRDTLGDTPCFEYLDRIDDVDLVGEKLSPEAARAALDTLADTDDESCRPLTLLAIGGRNGTRKPRYLALCEGNGSARDRDRSTRLDQNLRGIFHYNL
ncbi:MAG TPA: GH3 auxin-responsive promoter family protein, partial [Polyangia bacterium]